MASNDYGFNFGEIEPPVEEASALDKLDSMMTLGNSIYQKATNPELQGTNKVDPEFDLEEYMKALTPNPRNTVKLARNEDYANKMLATQADFEEKMSYIADTSWFIKGPGILAAGMTDPFNAIPVAGLGAKTFRMAQTLTKAQKHFDTITDMVTFGTIGAGFGIAAEAQAEATGQITDTGYTTVGMLGFALGGGLAALGHAFSPTEISTMNQTFNKSTDVINQLAGKADFVPPKVTHWAGTFGPSWSKSGILNVATKGSDGAREAAFRMDSTAMYATDPVTGNITPLPKNATDYKFSLNKVHNDYVLNANEAFNDARAMGYTGTAHELSSESFSILQDGLAARRAGQKWDFPDTPAGKEARHFSKYMQNMLDEGKALGIKNLDNVQSNEFYIPRMQDFAKIEADPTGFRNAVIRGISNGPIKRTPEEVIELADEYISNMNQLGMQREFADFGMFTPTDLPNTGRLQQRIPMDDRELVDFTITDLRELAAKYQYSQSGLYAVYKAFPEVKGMDTKDALEFIRNDVFGGVRDRAIAEGQDLAQAKVDFEALENMLQDLLGTLRMSDNPNAFSMRAARMSTKYMSIANGGQFVINAIAEFGNTTLSKDMKAIFNKNYSEALSDVANMLYKGGKPQSDMVQMVMNMGFLSDLTEYKSFVRHADVDTMFSGGSLENSLNKGNQALYKFNGTTLATAMLEVVNGAGAFDYISRLSTKNTLSEKDLKTMSRLGVSVDDLAVIRDLPYIKKNGMNVGVDMGKLTPVQEDALDTMMIAAQREARHTVAKGIGSYVPDAIKKPTPMKVLLLQFLRTPIEMNETLLRRGLSEDKAGMVTSLMLSVSIMSSILYLREQAEIAAGFRDESDARYDITTEEGKSKLLYTSFSKVGVAGVGSLLIEKGAAAAGVPVPGSDYADRDLIKSLQGPSFSAVGDVTTILQNALNGDIDNSRTANAAINLSPFHSLPVIHEGLRSYARELD